MNIEHLIDIPKQKIKGNLFDDRDKFTYYRSYESDVDELPRVVKFSGGRTSGYMLVSLLANGHLKPERGGMSPYSTTQRLNTPKHINLSPG